MLDSLFFWPTVFFILLALSVLSALTLLNPKIPLYFVRIHIVIVTLPPVAALFALLINREKRIFGPWLFDSLSWLLALFVLTLGLIVQRYSVRYLLGDCSYRKYFALLTLTTVADSLAWLSDDLRVMAACWGMTLLGLTVLIRLNKQWPVAKNAARFSGLLFALSWFILLSAVIWAALAAGQWQLSLILAKSILAQIPSWEKNGISLLLAASVVIPAAQWPFHRWLLDSVVAPTPVSAVMHAGIVNVGGILLTRFAPLFSGSTAQIVLLVLSSISVLVGTGIMLVHVDYKRQLVGSTIAQMGFMLIQCALGAYLAAIIHAVLHGLFKSTLFLQAGYAARRHEPESRKAQPLPHMWMPAGSILAVLFGIGYWLSASEESYQFISALILGWSMLLAWGQLVAYGQGRFGRIAGFMMLTVAAVVYGAVHRAFYGLLGETVQKGIQTPLFAAFLFLFILLAGSAAGLWLARHRTSTAFAVIYLWLVRLGEPHKDVVETHPEYLTRRLSRGGY